MRRERKTTKAQRSKRTLSLCVLCVFVVNLSLPKLALGGDDWPEIKRKKYIRASTEPIPKRPRYVLPPEARNRVKPKLPERPPQTVGPIKINTDKEPDIRVALATDTGTASITSNLPIAYMVTRCPR